MYWPGSYQNIFGAPDPVASFLSQTGPNATSLDCFNGTGLGCPSKCTDPEWMFGSAAVPSPLWSCTIWPNVTDRSLAGELSGSQESALAAVATEVDLSLAKNITFVISDCLAAYCSDLKGCSAGGLFHKCSANSLVLNGSTLSIDAVGSCVATICEHQHQTYANPDIAGIGVVKAYTIQLAVVSISIPAMWCLHLLHWLRIRLKHATKGPRSNSQQMTSRCWQARVFSLLQGLTDTDSLLSSRYGLTRTNRSWPTDHLNTTLNTSLRNLPLRRYRQRLRHRIRERLLWLADRIYFAWLAALPEFLKAQCFFSLSISIAALASLRSDAQLSSIDQTALWAAGHSGLGPVGITFCMISALNWRRPSWYLLLITSATWIVSLYVISLHKFTGSEVNSTSVSQWPDVCANAPPTNLCGITETHDSADLSYKYMQALGLFGIGAGILTVSQLVRLIFKKNPERSDLNEAETGTAALFFYQFPMFCMFFALENMTAAVKTLYQDGAVNRDWTFGQIVAVTVWLPPLTGFLNILLDGLPRAHSKLLPIGFEIVPLGHGFPKQHTNENTTYRSDLNSSTQTLVARRPINRFL